MIGSILVTGGAGFVGSNLVHSSLSDGHNVTIFDAFSRPGSERNLAWLSSQHRNGHLQCIQGDVRDDDLVRACRLAVEKIGTTAGQVYNIGGGPSNTLSIWREFGPLLVELSGEHIPVRFDRWRPGDQPCYVSDIRKANQHMGWRPQVDKETGIRRLWEWVWSNKNLFCALTAGAVLQAVTREKTA